MNNRPDLYRVRLIGGPFDGREEEHASDPGEDILMPVWTKRADRPGPPLALYRRLGGPDAASVPYHFVGMLA
jgi:hypothetical protein